MKSSVEEEETKFVKYADEAQIQAPGKLVVDLRNMVNNAEWSDVVFVCKDGKHVHGCRMLLAVRSTVLHRMLTNGMAESSLSNIKLPKISSPVLLSVFEFLYTGSVVKYPPEDWRTGFEIIRAVRFLFIDHLEAIMWKYLWKQVSAQRVLMGEAPEMLNVAMELEPLRDQTSSNIILPKLAEIMNSESIMPKLVEIMNSVLLESSMLWNLSEKAFSYFLTKTTGHKDLGRLEEYARLRLVIMWYAAKRDPLLTQVERDVIDMLLPGPTRTLTFFKNFYHVGIIQSPENYADSIWRRIEIDCKAKEGADSPADYLKSLLPDDNSRKFAATLLQSLDSKSLLSKINLQQVPPLLLLKVVEPLKIFPQTALKIALDYNAHLGASLSMSKFDFQHDSSFTQVSDELFIQKVRRTPDYTTLVLSICPRNKIETWSIVLIIDQVGHELLEVGLVDTQTVLENTKLRLSDKTLSCHGCTWGLKRERGVTSIWNNSGNIGCWQPTQKFSVRAGLKVEFTFIRKTGWWHIDVDGTTRFSSVSSNNQGKTFCPAVCLLGGRVLCQLKRGFAYLVEEKYTSSREPLS